MTLDKICQMTSKTETLNALHACRINHPMNNDFQWRNAWFICAQNHDIKSSAVEWLANKAKQEQIEYNKKIKN